MPANSTHPDYDASLPAWLRARDVIAGEDATKVGNEKYLPNPHSFTWLRLIRASNDSQMAVAIRLKTTHRGATDKGYVQTHDV